MNKKVVIWGHTPDTHTHSYIHYGFAKAFSYMDYDVIWYEDSPEYSNEDLTNAIVITEHNCCKYMPYEKSSKYFIHNIEDGFYNQSKFDGDNIYNLLVYHENYNWDSQINNLDDYSWYDPNTKTVVIMWATDLLPDEIDKNDEVIFDSTKKNVNYIGSLSYEYSADLVETIEKNQKQFINYGGYTGINVEKTSRGFVDSDDIMKLAKQSYLNFDVRPKCHIDNGYIPCRIFKTISYGCWIGCNSEKVSKFFGDRLTVNNNLSELYYDTENASKKATIDDLRDNMNYVRNNHTYINRINNILSIL